MLEIKITKTEEIHSREFKGFFLDSIEYFVKNVKKNLFPIFKKNYGIKKKYFNRVCQSPIISATGYVIALDDGPAFINMVEQEPANTSKKGVRVSSRPRPRFHAGRKKGQSLPRGSYITNKSANFRNRDIAKFRNRDEENIADFLIQHVSEAVTKTDLERI